MWLKIVLIELTVLNKDKHAAKSKDLKKFFRKSEMFLKAEKGVLKCKKRLKIEYNNAEQV